MNNRIKKHAWAWWGAGMLVVLVSAVATIGFLTITHEHQIFARALQRVNDTLRNELTPHAAISAISADMSEQMMQISEWYASGEWPAYDERQRLLAEVKANTVKMLSEHEEYCDTSARGEVLAEMREAGESLKLLGSQKDIIGNLEKLLQDEVATGCDDERASAGILMFYADAIAAESHQTEIYDSEYGNITAIEALGSFTRRYKTEDDVPYIKEIRSFMGKDRFSRFFTATNDLHTAVYAYANETDESKFEEGFNNLGRLQTDLQEEAMLYSMYLSQAINKASNRALERTVKMHNALTSGAAATSQDTHFNASVTTAYVLMSAISDFNISRNTVPKASSAEELAKDDLYLRLRDVPGLAYDGIRYSSGGTTATLTLTLGEETYDFVFIAEEPVAPATEQSRPV